MTGTAATGPISAALVAASSAASPTAQSTFTPHSSSTPSAGQGYSQSGTAVPGATALVSATTPLTRVRHITAPVSLDVAVADLMESPPEPATAGKAEAPSPSPETSGPGLLARAKDAARRDMQREVVERSRAALVLF